MVALSKLLYSGVCQAPQAGGRVRNSAGCGRPLSRTVSSGAEWVAVMELGVFLMVVILIVVILMIVILMVMILMVMIVGFVAEQALTFGEPGYAEGYKREGLAPEKQMAGMAPLKR